jgi:hypothetical protein
MDACPSPEDIQGRDYWSLALAGAFHMEDIIMPWTAPKSSQNRKGFHFEKPSCRYKITVHNKVYFFFVIMSKAQWLFDFIYHEA